MKLSEWLANSATSQSEFARQLGVTQGRISQIVAGEQPSLDLAMKIAGLTNNRVRPQDFKDMPMSKNSRHGGRSNQSGGQWRTGGGG